MKKVFRPHIILYTAGRLFSIILILAPLLMLYMFIKFAFFGGEINYKFIPLIAFALFLFLLDGCIKLCAKPFQISISAT